jgi:hypothetical protein
LIELVGLSRSCVTNKHVACGIIEAPSQKVIMLTTLQEDYVSCASLDIGKFLENPQN